ncbi:MAG: tetratricopeptide repeat protein [Planctomycetota bacterium]
MDRADSLRIAGRNAEALVELAEADTYSAAFGDGPTTAVLNLATLRAIIAARTGEHALAQEQLDRAVALGRGLFGEKDPNRAMFLHTQAIIHRGRGESDLAADVAREEWALRKSEVGERGVQALVALDWLVRHLLTQEHDNDALALARQLVELTDPSDAQRANRQQLLERARARADQRAADKD